MPDRLDQPRNLRRTPPLGVSGVTLLMLVTLVLTTSPGLGRSRDLSAGDATRAQVASERIAPTQRVERRVGGPREVPSRDTRPSAASHAVLLSFDRPTLIPLAAIEPHDWGTVRRVASLTEFVEASLLNLPPPAI